MKKFTIVALLFALGTFVACQEAKDAANKTGNAVENAANSVEEGASNLIDEVEDAVSDVDKELEEQDPFGGDLVSSDEAEDILKGKK